MDTLNGSERDGSGCSGYSGWDTDASDGCRADDLIPEESETVQLALKRLSPKEAYDRVFRMRRAFQVHTSRRKELARPRSGTLPLTGHYSAP